MLFDSWVGVLAPNTYRLFVAPVLERLIARIRARVDRPVIYFAHRAATLLDTASRIGADVLGIDWTLPLDRVVDRLGPETVVQGNLDPAALFAPRPALGEEIDAVLVAGQRAAAHIFNLGHGIHRTTDPDQVAFLVDRVRETSRRLYARA